MLTPNCHSTHQDFSNGTSLRSAPNAQKSARGNRGTRTEAPVDECILSMQKQLHHTLTPSYTHPRISLFHGATHHTLVSIPGLGGGADFPAETGRACQGHVQLGHQHHHLRPLHEAQTVVHAHAQAALQDLQCTAVQRNTPLGKHRARRVSPWAEGQRLPGERQAERRNYNGHPRYFRIRGCPARMRPGK